MTDKQELTLYCSWFCPYAQRAWISLEYKVSKYHYFEINPYKENQGEGNSKNSKSIEEKAIDYPDFVRVSPLGLVPALNHNEKGVCDSTVVMEYIDEVFPGENKLLPSDPVRRAKARFLGNYVNEKIISFFYKMLMSQELADQEKAKSDLLANLKRFISFLGDEEGPFLMGKSFAYLDILFVPWWQRFLSIAKHYRNFEVPTEGYERLHNWYSHCLQVPAYSRTIVDTQRLINNYTGYANNTATSDAAQKFRDKK